MLSGSVTQNREAIVNLSMQARDGGAVQVRALVDTGFTGYLALPPELIRECASTPAGLLGATLADGTRATFERYLATAILSDGTPRDVIVLASEGGPLLGMALLGGMRLMIHVVPGGEVRAE